MKDKNGRAVEVGAEVLVRFKVTSHAGVYLHLESLEADKHGHRTAFAISPSQVERADGGSVDVEKAASIES
jgi:hypothetical protein